MVCRTCRLETGRRRRKMGRKSGRLFGEKVKEEKGRRRGTGAGALTAGTAL